MRHFLVTTLVATSVATLVALSLPSCDGQGEEPDGGDGGGGCSSAEDCTEGLECEYGQCRATCSWDRDCAAGTACVAARETEDLRVCTAADESGCGEDGRACPAGLRCSSTGLCRESCVVDPHCGPDRDCVDLVCLEVSGDGGP